MGDGEASGALKGGDAARLIGVRAGAQARVDVGDSRGAPSLRGRIEIGVEHAGLAPELELEPDAFANLKGRRSEALDELACGHAEQAAAQLLGRRRRARSRRCGLLRTAGAGGQEQGGRKDEDTHQATMAALAAAGKLAVGGTGS
jgi:hypothetical protein